MLELETKAIHHFVNRDAPKNKKTILLLDGPIIDPPRPPVIRSDYIDYRCRAIKSCINRCPPVIIIGFNKRIMGNLYKNYVENITGRKVKNVYSDINLISLLFIICLEKNLNHAAKLSLYITLDR